MSRRSNDWIVILIVAAVWIVLLMVLGGYMQRNETDRRSFDGSDTYTTEATDTRLMA